MSPLLTSSQKGALAQLATKAFQKQLEKGNTHGMTPDQFRQIGVFTATDGKAEGLRTATDAQFLRIKTHFIGLAEGDEFTAAMDEGTEGRKRILFRIDEAMTKGRFGPAYVETICRNRWQVGETWRDDLTDGQLIRLSQTLTKNAATRRAKAQKAA